MPLNDESSCSRVNTSYVVTIDVAITKTRTWENIKFYSVTDCKRQLSEENLICPRRVYVTRNQKSEVNSRCSATHDGEAAVEDLDALRVERAHHLALPDLGARRVDRLDRRLARVDGERRLAVVQHAAVVVARAQVVHRLALL